MARSTARGELITLRVWQLPVALLSAGLCGELADRPVQAVLDNVPRKPAAAWVVRVRVGREAPRARPPGLLLSQVTVWGEPLALHDQLLPEALT